MSLHSCKHLEFMLHFIYWVFAKEFGRQINKIGLSSKYVGRIESPRLIKKNHKFMHFKQTRHARSQHYHVLVFFHFSYLILFFYFYLNLLFFLSFTFIIFLFYLSFILIFKYLSYLFFDLYFKFFIHYF